MRPAYRPALTFGDGIPPAVKGLLLVNVAVFVVQLLVERSTRMPVVEYLFALWPAHVLHQGKVWQLFTYQFLHADPMHLLYNMLGLFFFGRAMEWHWGSHRFLTVYLISGLAGGIVTWLASLNSVVPTLGASGAVLGVLVAFGLTFPDAIIFINFFIPMKAKWLVIIYAALNIFGTIGGRGGISYTAHLGGMAAGFLAWRWEEAWIMRGRYHPALKDKVQQWRRQREERLRTGRAKKLVRDRDQIDSILEKISREGMESLTEGERRILEEASREDR